MKNTLCKIKDNVRFRQALKVILCLFILVTIFRLQFSEGVKSFENYKDYTFKNDNEGGDWFDLAANHSVAQEFISAGNILNNVQLYYGNSSEDRDVEISVKDVNGKTITDVSVNTSEFNKNTWNDVGLSTDKLIRDEIYTLSISSEEGLEGFIYGNGNTTESFMNFSAEGTDTEGHLLMGVSQTYSYCNLAVLFELMVTTLFSSVIGIALCISIWKFEEVYGAFLSSSKYGFSYALFFSVSIILLYNPIDDIRTKVITFKRVIGMGLNNDVDVSRRISNFNNWFIAFGVVFILLFMLANYYLGKAKSEDQKKVIAFLDNYMIVANCSLILRCITYFKDASATTTIYYFSQDIIMLFALVATWYVFFAVDRFINIEKFEQIACSVVFISIALAVFWGKELGKGRIVLGIAAILFAVVLVFCKYLGKICEKEQVEKALPFIAIILSFIPLATSLYIELIHVLNQHNVFVSHPAKYYKIACILGFLIAMIALYMIIKKNYQIRNWKSIVFPITVAGITCLSIQIPLSSVYNLDLFESANSSILMSDFLNYGDIPIVQHYGGHMMTGVWEGILYAIVNNDFAGIVSPYGGLINVVLALLFYFVVAKIWDREMGLVISLLFPFLGFISHYGLGFLVCIAAMAYIRKNNIKRAILLWGSFVWCALYKLDLGFAFGIAVIIALLIYVIVEKNVKAFKELGLSLIGWGIIGGIAWFVICIVKGLNPINRLIEFLMINLSNQNWAYTGIGTVDNLLFAWGYIIVPFAMVLSLIYTIFSKGFKEKIGTERWILLLILNLSYFQNFSRGLVRHSLAENSTTIVFWCAYLFLAMFLAFYKENMKWFVPAFLVLIVLNGLFLKPDNFASLSIADSAVSAPESIIESWKPTRFYDEEDEVKADDGSVFKTEWERIKYTQENVERVEFADDLSNYAAEYEILLNELLEDDETFVDFVNKTVLYSVMGYRCPVYVSQSPLQLSGEFTQKEFIKEIEGVPVVFMPVDDTNYRASNSLDGVTNAYRYYAVYEYIYRNYKPLCRYGDEYAVWCLPEKYDAYKKKVASLMQGKEYVQDISASELIGKRNVEIEAEKSTVIVRYTGIDPMLTELQNLIDVSAFAGQKMKITIDYETDTSGIMQLYYTTEEYEDYSAEKVVDAQISENGTATFIIPITEYSRLRLDIPEESTVTIKALKAGSTIEYIDYGYDGPVENVDEAGNITYGYINALHNTSIAKLPRIWAETDKQDSINNQIVCSLTKEDEYYVFDNNSVPVSDNGNYLKISADYDGVDTEGKYAEDDESVGATVIFGYYKNGVFEQKYRYAITFDEGSHDYLIRCSTDYYWYLKEVNAIKIETTGNLRNVSMNLLEGD